MSEGWIITNGNDVKMTTSHGKRSIVFKKLEKNLYYLEGKPGGNATEVNATVWEDLTDNDMPALDGAFESSDDDDSDEDEDMPMLID